MKTVKESANFIWSIADLLRGDYKQSDYGKIILPLTVIRRLDCVLESTKVDVLKKYDHLKTTNVENLDPILNKTAGFKFHNKSQFDFEKLIADPNNIASNLRNYINGFSEDAREIIEQFEFENQINKLAGFRLNFSFIENAVEKLNFINEFKLHIKNDNLYAFYISKKKNKLSDLKNFLKKKFPDYMIPKKIINVKNFPFNDRGKINYKVLEKKI